MAEGGRCVRAPSVLLLLSSRPKTVIKWGSLTSLGVSSHVSPRFEPSHRNEAAHLSSDAAPSGVFAFR